MVYHEKCSCGNQVVITTVETTPVVVGGNSYLIRCSSCNNEVRTISSRSTPDVSGGYVD